MAEMLIKPLFFKQTAILLVLLVLLAMFPFPVLGETPADQLPDHSPAKESAEPYPLPVSPEIPTPSPSDLPPETPPDSRPEILPDLLPDIYKDAPEQSRLNRMCTPNKWDDWQCRISGGISAAAERVDQFFGDERLEDDNKGTRLKVGLGFRYHKEDKGSVETEIKARVALPQLKNRFQLVLDDTFEADGPDDTGDYTDALKDSEPDTSLRYIIQEKAAQRINADLGIRGTSPSQVYGRLRGRFTLPWNLWELQLTQTVYWYTSDGFVETSEMRWSRTMGPEWLLRFKSRLKWEEQEDGCQPSQSISVFKKLTRRRGYAFSVSGSWPEVPHTREAMYRTEFTYRQLIHRSWLFFELSPGIEFPQETNYDVTPYMEFMVSVIFDENL